MNNLSLQGMKLSSLYTLPKAAEGYRLDSAFYTAMSMDYSYWKTLLALQGGVTEAEEVILSQELAHTWFMVQTDSSSPYAMEKMDDHLRNVFLQHTWKYNKSTGKAHCFHAKLAFLKYTKTGTPDYYRIGVFSKNLTNDGDFQNICVLDGFAKGAKDDNGRRLWAYLEYCKKHSLPGAVESPEPKQKTQLREQFDAHIDRFQSVKDILLPKECDIFFTGLGAAGISLGKDTCLWDILVEKPFSQWCKDEKLYAVTKSRFVRGYWPVADPNGANPKIEVYNCYQESDDGDVYSDKTHMKLYWRKVSETPAKWEFWAGSANCSGPSLGRMPDGSEPSTGINVECLVRFRDVTDDTMQSFVEGLQKTDPPHHLMKKQPNEQDGGDGNQKAQKLQNGRDLAEEEHGYRHRHQKAQFHERGGQNHTIALDIQLQ